MLVARIRTTCIIQQTFLNSRGAPRPRADARGRTQRAYLEQDVTDGWSSATRHSGIEFCRRSGSTPSQSGFRAVPAMVADVCDGLTAPRDAAFAIFASSE